MEEPPYSPPRIGQGNQEAEVVATWQLANAFRAFVNEFQRLHQRHTSTWGAPDTTVGPVQFVAFRTGYSERYLSRILACETEFTSLSVADSILIAIEKHHYLTNEIPVVPNPRWSQEKWQEYMRERGCI